MGIPQNPHEPPLYRLKRTEKMYIVCFIFKLSIMQYKQERQSLRLNRTPIQLKNKHRTVVDVDKYRGIAPEFYEKKPKLIK